MNEPKTNGVIEELEITIVGTNRLAVVDAEREALVATLRPIVSRISAAKLYADTLNVIDETGANLAAQTREQIVEDSSMAEKALREFDHNLVERLHKTHRAWTALIGRFTDPLNDAAKKVKQKVIQWQQQEIEKAEKERAALQAKLDAEAAAERLRLEKAAEKIKTPELKQQRLEAAAQVVAPVVQVAAPAKAVKAQARWFVKSVDKAFLCKAAAKDKSLLGYVEVDEAKLARAKSANSECEIPGVVFEKRFV